MALAGTHIRFALDVREDFGVSDERRYVAGAVYPDSRYPTGIDRDLTHGDNQMEREFWRDDDFRKGWASHLLYDYLQRSVRRDWFPQLHQRTNPDVSGEQSWVNATAIKLIQDINDVQTVDITPYLPHLEHVETPNGEDADTMRAFTQNFIRIYSELVSLQRDDMQRICADWSMSGELIERVVDTAQQFTQDAGMLKRVHSMYDETMKRKNEFWERYCK